SARFASAGPGIQTVDVRDLRLSRDRDQLHASEQLDNAPAVAGARQQQIHAGPGAPFRGTGALIGRRNVARFQTDRIGVLPGTRPLTGLPRTAVLRGLSVVTDRDLFE